MEVYQIVFLAHGRHRKERVIVCCNLACSDYKEAYEHYIDCA